MRARRTGPVVTLLLPACMALTLGRCAHAPGGAPSAQGDAVAAHYESAGAVERPDADLLAFVTARITAEAVRHRFNALVGSGTAAHVAAELHALGLEPAGDSATFVQRLPADRIITLGSAAGDVGDGDDGSDRSDAPRSVQPAAAIGAAPVVLRATGAQGADSPVFGRDFFVHSTTSSSVSGTLVWAGVAAPGRPAPGPEAGGRVLAFYLPGEEPDKAWHAALWNAVQGSVEAGAAAVLLVLDPELTEATMATLASRPSDDTTPAMAVGLRYDAASRIFRNGLRDLDQLRNGPNQLVPVTGTTITLDAAGGAVTEGRPGNLVAILPGSDPVLKDTYVVFSAPIAADIGRPALAASPSTGASPDPAGSEAGAPARSAAAALLEIAAVYASLPARPARSLIFLGAAADGDGPLGSRYFAANPPVPASLIVASISIDGVLDNATDTIAAVGQHYTSMGPLLHQIALAHPELKLAVAPDLSPEDDRFLTSDSFSFARIGAPALSFTAAPPHDSSATTRPAIRRDDTIDSKDADRLARITRFIFYFGHALASRAERPIWTAEGRAAVQKDE